MAPKRSAAEKKPSPSSQPPPKKSARKQREPSPESPPPKRSKLPQDYPAPPKELFDAQIDLAATIATNAAALHGDVGLETHLHQWRRYLETRLGGDRTVAVHVVAAFVEGQRAEGKTLTAGERSTAQGSDVAEGPSDPLAARVKSIGELMGAQEGRGHDCLKGSPDATTAFRTLSVEDATLYVLNCFAEQRHSALHKQLGDEAASINWHTEREGEPFGGALPMVWGEQLAQWRDEGVEARERYARMGKTIARCLPGLPVFVMKNGGRYLATSHLKYVLGLEKRTYELFRILRLKNREENGPLSQPMDSDSDSGGSDTEDPGDVWDAAHRFKGLTAGEGVPRTVHVAETYAERKAREHLEEEEMMRRIRVRAGRGNDPEAPTPRALLDPRPPMVQALSTLAPNSSPEELAQVVIKSAVHRGVDVFALTGIAEDQVVALQGWKMADRFRKASIELMAEQLEAAVADEPPPEAFKAVEARQRARLAARLEAEAEEASVDLAHLGLSGKTEEGATDGRKGKRVTPERVIEPGPNADWSLGGSGAGLEEPPSRSEYLDEPDPEAETDEWTAELDWEVKRYDRPGFVPNAPVPIKTLGEISRFWRDFGIPDQVIVMQRHYNQTWERHHEGSHNLWAFKVLSNIFPVSRFLKSAPSSETFVAFDLARQALDKFTPQEDFGRNLAIAAYALSEGVAADLDIVHADGRDLLRMVRGQGRGPASALGSGAAAGVPKSEEEQLRNALAQQDYLHARAARASVTMAAVQVEKERMEDERT